MVPANARTLQVYWFGPRTTFGAVGRTKFRVCKSSLSSIRPTVPGGCCCVQTVLKYYNGLESMRGSVLATPALSRSSVSPHTKRAYPLTFPFCSPELDRLSCCVLQADRNACAGLSSCTVTYPSMQDIWPEVYSARSVKVVEVRPPCFVFTFFFFFSCRCVLSTHLRNICFGPTDVGNSRGHRYTTELGYGTRAR